ncbi:hypothetical protein UA08_07599 [Talaromyces atroroseus]|uniref:Pentatricopeptide repeat-containing protein n=1 Tax=Talaromyces atroroseus TaxID=1441469 RepID=A0A225AS57_TALAT|nr:hypothetical protein UA08_07599 [Talaromyces atroroseus]OKL57265.1 hypothetical protein UA08_07599 [Talaromyces atroroseus]
MLRCSNVCLRYLGAGTRIHSAGSQALLKASALPRSRFDSFQRNASSATQPYPFDTENDYSEQWDRNRERRPRVRQVGTGLEDSYRNVRLSETLSYSRKQKKRARREIRGDNKEVDLLMELSKGRSLPEGVNPTVVNKELQWLKDPKELSNRVARLLDAGQVPLAVAMIRKSESLRIDSSAAWNRLLGHCFKRGAPLAAFKFYNDMKKRARAPTDRTYTVMLRGLCLRSRQSVKHVELAKRVYQQLLSPSSGVQPSHYHHHAMLEVCGTYHDMDALWDVIGKLPENGRSKPNAQTFTVILMALRNSFDNDIESIPEDKMELRKKKRESFIRDSKRIWLEIITQWQKGQLEIDNELVGAMATVLSDPMDELNSYNVLALFNQTMGIPILLSQPKDLSMKGSAQGKWEAAVRASKDRPNYTNWQSLNSESDAADEEELEDIPFEEEGNHGLEDENAWEHNLEGVFDPVDKVNTADGPSFLVPNNMVLNHILTVCRILSKGTAAGRGYWNLFTLDEKGYNVKPDEGNFHEYLRLLRISRSSHTAVDVIKQQMVPAGLVEGKTFHIAMSCCLRDRTNPNVLVNAQALLSLMKDTLPLPDPRPLKSFIDLSDALTENPQWLLGLRGLEDIDQNSTNLTMMGRNMRWALHKTVIASLEPHINRLYESMKQQADLPPPSFSAPSPSADAVNGFLAVEFMIKAREMLDKCLGSQFEDIITKSDRDWVAPLAIKLRMFSKSEVANKLRKAHIRPLTHHYLSEKAAETEDAQSC